MILTGCQKDTNPTHLPFGLSAFLSSEYGQVFSLGVVLGIKIKY